MVVVKVEGYHFLGIQELQRRFSNRAGLRIITNHDFTSALMRKNNYDVEDWALHEKRLDDEWKRLMQEGRSTHVLFLENNENYLNQSGDVDVFLARPWTAEELHRSYIEQVKHDVEQIMLVVNSVTQADIDRHYDHLHHYLGSLLPSGNLDPMPYTWYYASLVRRLWYLARRQSPIRTLDEISEALEGLLRSGTFTLPARPPLRNVVALVGSDRHMLEKHNKYLMRSVTSDPRRGRTRKNKRRRKNKQKKRRRHTRR